jgi:hypothetical protein
MMAFSINERILPGHSCPQRDRCTSLSSSLINSALGLAATAVRFA